MPTPAMLAASVHPASDELDVEIAVGLALDRDLASGTNRQRPDSREDRWPTTPFRLQVATEVHTPAINSLRERAYAAAGYFSLPDPRTVHRSTDSPSAISLALMSGDALAATARFTPAFTRQQAENVIEGDVDLAPHWFPTIVLCRGATEPAFRGLGLMAFMAVLGVAIAKRAGFGSATAVMYDGTPHYRAMARAGWKRKPVGGERMATVQGNVGLSLVYIGQLAFEDSIAHSAAVHARLNQQVGADAVVNDVCRRIQSPVLPEARLLPA